MGRWWAGGRACSPVESKRPLSNPATWWLCPRKLLAPILAGRASSKELSWPMRWASPSPWRGTSEPCGRKMGCSSSLRVVLVLTAVVNSAAWGQNAKPVNGSSPASSTPQTAVATPATKNEKLSDKTDRNESRAWLLPGEDPENHLTSPFLKHLGQDQKAFWTAPLDLHR